MKKKLLSIFLAIVMAVVPMLFAGCEFDLDDETGSGGNGGSGGSGGENSGSFYTQFIDGFKVVYSKSQIGQEANIDMEINGLYRTLLDTLNIYYGGRINENPLFPDSIRQTIYQDTEGKAKILNEDIKWLWTLNPNLNPNEDVTVNDVKNLTKNDKNESKDYSNFKTSFNYLVNNMTYPQLSSENYYSKPLQIVLFETMLGYDQTVFEAEVRKEQIADNEGKPQYIEYFEIKIISSQKTELNGICIYRSLYKYWVENGKKKTNSLTTAQENEQILVTPQIVKDYLGDWKQKTGLMGEYQNKATYSGLTKTDADALITYILNNVIGAEVVKHDYDTFGPNSSYYNNDTENVNYVENGKNFYNYRYYVGRVAEMVYSQVYDGSDEFVYTYKGDGFEIKYDYISEYKKQNGEDALPDVNKASMRPQSASFLRDYDTDMFFSNADAFDIFGDSNSEAHSFDNSPMSEYQSVVLMPKESITLSGMWMQIFSPNPDLAINVYVRYYAYNKETGKGQLYTFTQDEINFYQSTPYDNAYEGRDCEYHKYVEGKGYLYKTTEKDNDGKKIEGYYADFEVTVDVTEVSPEFVEKYDRNDPSQIALDSVKLDEFNNSESDPKLKAEGTATNGIVEASLNGEYAYKVIPSKNGFGGVTVLDERKVDFTFFEMVFDIQKDPTLANQNYDYKLSIVTPL